MKKNIIITIGIIFFTIFIITLACVPKILKEYENKSNSVVKNNCKIIVQDVINIKDMKKLSEKSKEFVEKYNETYKNPITNKESAFTVDKKCIGCVSVSYDENTKSINVTGYDKDLEILCRTVVKPPSYVTYEREEK